MALEDPSKLAATALILFTLMSTIQARTPHVTVANCFHTATEFACNSNKHSQRTYTAASGEMFYFSFDPEDNQYWDCLITNKDRHRVGTFRLWGDDTHGGPKLFSCINCSWSLDDRGVFFYLDSVWRYWYIWDV